MLLRVLAVVAAVSGWWVFGAEASTLVLEGVPNAVIVTAESPDGCVPTAVSEFNAHIEKITGTPLEVKAAPDDAQAPLSAFVEGKVAVLIGASAYTRALGLPSDDVAPEGFVIRSIPGGLAIVGNDEAGFHVDFDKSTASAGTLYGVYRFLEELGCRWFYPDRQYDVIPERATLQVPEFDIRDAPYFEYRFAYGNAEWRRKVGYGGTVDPWRTRHTFEGDRVRKRYGESHPQILERGFHFPHPGVMDLVVGQAREYLASSTHIGRKYFLVIPQDAYSGCDCPICRPLRTPARGEDGEFSDIIGAAVVETAEKVRDLPGKIVYCAYEKYRRPPQKIAKLPDNVVVLMAVHRAPFHDPTEVEKAWAAIDEWRPLDPSRFYFCRYYENLRKVTPSFVPHLIARDIQRMRDYRESNQLPMGGEMNFGSVAADHPYAWWFCLDEYVTAKLLWDPNRDVDALLDDYYESFFGVAAAPMKKLFGRFEELYFDPAERHLYSVAVIDELMAYFAEAETLAKGTPWQAHVAYVGKGLEPLAMMRRKLAAGPEATDQAGPDVHFTFDEGRGATTRSVAGEVEGALTETAWTDGVRGAALRFDGDTSFVRFPGKNLAGTDYSFEMWVKPEAVTFDRSQFLLGPTALERHGLMLREGSLALMHRYQGSSYFNTRSRLFAQAGEFKPHEWHHVAASFSRTNGMSIYINGVLVAMDPALTKPSEYGVAFIGAGGQKKADDLGGFFKGVIDEVKVYRREITPQEVKSHYESERPKQP